MSDPYSQKPWLKFYDEHVPPTLEYPEKTYAEVFHEGIENVYDRVAVYYMGKGITFRELDVLSNKFAHFLKKAGLSAGDTVGVHLPNIPAYYISIIGIQKTGCVLTGVSPLLQPKELEYQLNDSGAKVLVTLDVLLDKVEAVIRDTGVKAVAILNWFLILVKVVSALPVENTLPTFGQTRFSIVFWMFPTII